VNGSALLASALFFVIIESVKQRGKIQNNIYQFYLDAMQAVHALETIPFKTVS
jgi:hypothetical protein